MSTVPYGDEYEIGNIGWEGIPEGWDITACVPTYGRWAGPGWSGGRRVPKGAEVWWWREPCMNNSIDNPGSVPNNCYSLLDAIAKHHDYQYYLAELNKDAGIIIEADKELLIKLAEVAAALETNNTYTYTTVNNEVPEQYTYVGKFDDTEKLYINLLVPAFTIKLYLWDVPQTIWSSVLDAFNSIWSGLELTSTTFTDPDDPSRTVKVKEQNGGILYEHDNNVEKTNFGWILDPSIEQAFTTAEVTFGEGGTNPIDTFVYVGNGECLVYGSTARDLIEVDRDAAHRANLILAGGTGIDWYYLTAGSNYGLSDEGENSIFKEGADGQYGIVGNFYKKAMDVAWLDPLGDNQLTHSSPWTIVFEDGTTIDLGAEFESGDYGIYLIDIPNVPETVLNISGDLEPRDFDPIQEGVQTQTDELGNVITTGAAQAGREDIFYDSSDRDRIEAMGGDDVISAFRGGDDYLLGGDGRDRISSDNTTGALSDRDLIEGGAGADILQGGPDSDLLFSETYGEMGALIALGEVAQGVDEQGDLIGGGSGNDFVYGSDRRDGLFGGEGHDLLVGGAGDDVILGDGDFTSAGMNWSYLVSGEPYFVTFTELDLTLSIIGGDDTIYAGAGNDFVYGGAGDDEVYAGQGTDIIIGEAGDDFIDGGEGNDFLDGDATYIDSSEHGWDVMFGGSGDDRIQGEGGNDYLDGEEDADTVIGGAGDDEIYGGIGNDVLHGDAAELNAALHGDDFIDGEGGNDVIVGQGGSDDLYGGDGDDQIDGDASYVDASSHGNDLIFGGIGNDRIQGWGGDDYLDGEDGADVVLGGAGDDVIFGGEGIDQLAGDADDINFAEHGVDFIDGGVGDDYIVGHGGGDELSGGDGNDEIHGDGSNVYAAYHGDDWIYGGSGNDRLFGYGGNDVLEGDGDNDFLAGGAGDDSLDGGSGDDTLEGSEGSDTYVFGRGYGHDIVTEWDGNWANTDTITLSSDISPSDVALARVGEDLRLAISDTGDSITVKNWFWSESPEQRIETILFADGTAWNPEDIKQMALLGSDGSDVLIGYSGADHLQGFMGNDSLYGRGGNDTLEGGAGDDHIYGEEGDDTLAGGEGTDTLVGGGGGDVIDGGEENDFLLGGIGNDTYLFGRGSGEDTIIDTDSTPGNIDAVTLASDVNPSDMTARRNGDDLTLSISGTTDVLKAKDWFRDEAITNRIEEVRFSAGTIWNSEMIKTLVLQGSPGDDFLTGYGSNDLLDGGAGNDTLTGNAGNDTYKFGRGYGQDSVLDLDAIPGNIDTIELAPDVLVADVAMARAEDDLFLLINGTNDALQVEEWFSSEINKVERILFSDGTNWDVTTILSMLPAGPTEVADYITGTPLRDILDGGGGNDIINGLEGDDDLYGADGIDLLYGDAGNDKLFGGEGNDTIYGGGGFNEFYGGPGSDELYGEVHAQDIYHVERGGGFDRAHVSMDPGSEDMIVFGEGIVPQDIFVQTGTYFTNLAFLAIGLHDSDTDGISIHGFGSYSSINDMPVKRFLFADGNELTLDQVLAFHDGGVIGDQVGDGLLVGSIDEDFINCGFNDTMVEARGSHDVVWGNYGNDVVSGGWGDDAIHDEYGGANIVAGGRDNDYIACSRGSNVYCFNRGDGSDAIIAMDNYAVRPFDVLSFGPGIRTEDIFAYTNECSLMLTIQGGTDQVEVGYFLEWSDQSTLESSQHISLVQFIDWDGNARVFDIKAIYNSISGQIFSASPTSPVPIFTPETMVYEVPVSSPYGGSYAIDYALTGNLFSIPVNFTGGAENDCIRGGTGHDTINTGDGDNTVYAGAGNDVITGGSGHDIVYAGDGDDVIRVCGGYEIWGGAGNDTYEFGVGYGSVKIHDLADSSGGNRIIFGENIWHNDLRLRPGSLIIEVGTSGDAIHLDNFNPEDAFGSHAIESFEFYDGQVLSYAELIEMKGFDISGTETDDLIWGTNATDRITGSGGNDLIAGGAGNDILEGGSGNDTYMYNLGDGIDTIRDLASVGVENLIIFGDGIQTIDLKLSCDSSAETIIVKIGTGGEEIRLSNFNPQDPYGQHAIEHFQFAGGEVLTYAQLIGLGFDLEGTAGDDTLTGTGASDRITGGPGNDTIHGGEGNDCLTGGEGDDTYRFSLGDGTDTVVDSVAPGQGNTLLFGPEITADDLSLGYEGDTLVIRVGAGGDEIRLGNFDPNDAFTARGIETFRFADGTSLSYAQLAERGFDLAGTLGNDNITGTNVMDRITALDGNDVVSAGEGDDLVDSGAGDDVIQGGAGDDRIYAGFGNDTILAGSGADRVDAGQGDDILTGGAGDDELIGGAGSDTYVFHVGDGADTIRDTATLTEGNLILFGEGITRQDLVFNLDGNVLVIQVGLSGDSITLPNFDLNNVNGSQVVSTLEFSDGSRVALADLFELGTEGDDIIQTGPVDDVIRAKGGNDLVSTDGGNDTIDAGTGNDSVYAGPGNDLLIGGQGNDLLDGGDGDDRYVFHVGDGADTIQDTATLTEGNLILFGEGITRQDLVFNLDGNVLVIQVGQNGDSITLPNFDLNNVNGSHVVRTLQFADGTQVPLADLVDLGTEGDDIIQTGPADDVIRSRGGNDLVTTDGGNDTIDAGAGNDAVYAGPGNDLLIGGPGNDLLDGGDGDDRYVFNAGDGLDSVYDSGGSDSLALGQGLDAEHTVIRLDGSSGRLRFLDAEGNETAEGMDIGLNPDGSIPVEVVQFADGTGFNPADLVIQTATTYGTDQNDVLRTGRDDDLIYALNGNDIVYAGSSHDTVFGANGSDRLHGENGNDTLYGENGNDTLYGGSGNDVLDGGNGNDMAYGENGDDILRGGLGNDFLDGEKGNDELSGGSGDDILAGGDGHDRLYGEGGSDVLSGGMGDDLLIGGAGDDVYTFRPGDGRDLLLDQGSCTDGNDSVRFGEGITRNDVALFGQGNNFYVQYGDEDVVEICGQTSASEKVERLELSDGRWLTDADVNVVIQQISAYAIQEGINLNSVEDVRMNQEMMTIIANSWHQG